MDPQLIVDRRRLRDLLDLRPEWKLQDFADALGRSLSWVGTMGQTAAPG
jgi:hypothetical protein